MNDIFFFSLGLICIRVIHFLFYRDVYHLHELTQEAIKIDMMKALCKRSSLLAMMARIRSQWGHEFVNHAVEVDCAVRLVSLLLADDRYPIEEKISRVNGCLEQLGVLSKKLLTNANTMRDVIKASSEDEVVLRIVDFDVVESVRSVVKTYQDGDIAIHLDIRVDEFYQYLKGDKDKTEWIIKQLISNAIKYSDSKNKRENYIVVRVEAEIQMSGLVLRIDVEDRGVGISESQKKNIFDEIGLRQPITLQKPGWGCALNWCDICARKMGGSLSVISKEGIGSIFTFSAPYQLSCSENIIRDSQLSIDRKSYKRILCCEDEGEQRGALVAYVMKFRVTLENNQKRLSHVVLRDEENGVECIAADDGCVAQEVFEKSLKENEVPIDLIIIDEHMQTINGTEAIKKIRELEAMYGKAELPVRIILCTGGCVEDVRKSTKDFGINNILSKPFAIEELEKAMRDDDDCDEEEVFQLPSMTLGFSLR